jgi:glycosyltransferase involved in cell wall biosynthesis
MKISVIIPAFNEERLLGETLGKVSAALEAFVERGWETEIIVCDNNSNDRTAEVARAGGARVVFEPVNQIGRARNTGAATASGDWFLFVDADTHPSYDLLRDVAGQIQGGQCLAGGSTVCMHCDHTLANWALKGWNRLSKLCRLMAGSFIFCEADAFRSVGGFSNVLFVGEEIDLSQKLKRVARKQSRRIVILHQHPITTSPRKIHLYSKGEYLAFMARLFFTLGRAKRWRKACAPWYDGRR